MVIPKRKGEFYSPLTDGVLRNHLEHKYAVAVFAGERSSRFLCFDVDDGRRETVGEVIGALMEMGFPRCGIHVSLSGGKGYHIEVFFDKLVRTEKLKRIYQRVLDLTELTVHQVEFRPTNSNAIKLPLSVHARTGNICWFVDRDTLAPIERYDYLLEIEQVPAELVDEIVPDAACEAEAQAGKGQDLVQEGTRHNQMRSIAVYMRQTGQTREAIQNALLAWYERQDKSLIRSDRETVLRDIEELLEWIFSERFVLHQRRESRPFRITALDIHLVLSAGSRSRRRVLFLLLARSIVGLKNISLADIAHVTGLSKPTVLKAVKQLQEDGLLNCRTGARIYSADGCFISERNQYTVYRYSGGKEKISFETCVDEVMKHFDDCYHQAIDKLIAGRRQEAYLPADE